MSDAEDRALAGPGRRRLAALAIAAAIAAAALVGWGTRYPGPGLYGDAAGYLSAAESMARGTALRVSFAPYNSADSTAPLAQWPPAFSWALSVPVRAGLSAVDGARLVQSIVVAATIALTVVALGAAAGSLWGVVLAVVLLATTSFVGVHLNVVSEPLYILCLAATVVAMVWRPDRPLTYGLSAGVSSLVRYLGVATVAGGGIWALAQPSDRGLLTRGRRVVLALIPGIALREAWVAYVRRSGGQMRPLHIDHHVGEAMGTLARATAAWLAPWDGLPGLRSAFKIVLAAAIGAALASELFSYRLVRAAVVRWHIKVRGHPVGIFRSPSFPRFSVKGDAAHLPNAATTRRLVLACLLLAGCHLAALLAARVMYSDVTFNDRMVAPVHYLFDVAAVGLIALRWPTGRAWARVVMAGLAAVWLAGSGGTTVALIRTATTVGLDHARLSERQSPTIAWLRAHGNDAPIYTNEPAKIYLHLHRPSRSLPWVFDADTARALHAALAARPGLIVWFSGGVAVDFVAPDLVPRALTPAKLVAALPLREVAHLADGDVWLREPSPAPAGAP